MKSARPSALSSKQADVIFEQLDESPSSAIAIAKYVKANYGEVSAAHLKKAYAAGVQKGKLVQSGPPWVKRLGIAVPYAAVVSAGASNVVLSRLPEIQSGVPIAAPDGTQLGVSKAAAQSAVINTVLSRNLLLPIAPMLLPPIAMMAVRSVLPLGAIAAAAAETCFVAGSIYGALPVAIAVFPQEMKIDVNVLEPEFRQAKDKSGKAIEYVLCNKGL